MSKVRNLPQSTTPGNSDLLYIVDSAVGPNASKKILFQDLKNSILEDHGIEHLPNGQDALATGDPITINADGNNDEGTANAFARRDHKHNIAVGNAASQTPDQANSQGSSNTLSRADHVHNIATGSAVGLNSASANTQGTASSFARSDHTHAIASAAPVSQAPDQANAVGSSTGFAKADHVHNIPTAIVVAIGSANAQGSANTFAKSDHVHEGIHSLKVDGGSARFGDINLVSGSRAKVEDDGSGNFSISANTELLVKQTATPFLVSYNAGYVRFNGASQFVGASSLILPPSSTGNIYVDIDGVVKSNTIALPPPNSYPLAEYVTDLSGITLLVDVRILVNQTRQAGSAIQLTPDLLNAAGTSENYSRADHVHNIPTAAAIGLNAESANAQGSASSFARSDHSHAIATAAASTQTPDQANAVGSSTSLARADHVHNIPTATPVSTGTANAQGSANSFARSDHSHNTVIANSLVESTVDATTTSLTDVLLTGMTITPPAGTYAVIFHSSTVNSGNGAERNYFSIYVNGIKDAASEKRIGISGGAVSDISCGGIAVVNGSQAIEVRWRVIAGTGTAYQRKLVLLRLC